MRATEDAAFAKGVSAEELMEQAGTGIARTVVRFFPNPGICFVYAGKGHNGGDAFVAARHLANEGWKIELRLVFPESELASLTKEKLLQLRDQLSGHSGHRPSNALSFRQTVILDGLLGLGSHPPLREPLRSACREINSLGKRGVQIFAADLPSGLDGETGSADEDCVIADFTVTIGCTKSGLVADSAIDFVGRLEVVTLPELQPDKLTDSQLATAESLRDLLPRRPYSSYKNQFGRIGIVAGSRGFTGAAVMCSSGALRAGAGLVELFVLEDIYPIIASAAPPEVMVKPIQSYAELLQEPVDIWAIGPGLGKSHSEEILQLISNARQPMVIDADGLNILAESTDVIARPHGPRLLTPHPGEMKRLFPNEYRSRAEIARHFCDRCAVTLLLKGSRTIVAEHDRPLSYNSTGNPGMATGGMGDVLTGVCAGLLGSRLTPYDAARVGAWICGRAAELAVFNGSASEESLLPGDVLMNLGVAFNELRAP
jgi:NAD(P)H-hydrate epimerase